MTGAHYHNNTTGLASGTAYVMFKILQ